MARGRSTFRERDVVRVINAATKAGLRVSGVRINPQAGTIEVVTVDLPGQDSAPLDQWMAEHACASEGD
jgi:hypothetical protein